MKDMLSRVARSQRFHALILLLLVVVVVGVGRQAATAAAPKADAHALVAAGATLLDVRTPGEFAERHLDGALNVPVDQVHARLGELPADRPIVVYCKSGRRAERAAEVLRKTGYTVHVLGGIDAW